MFSNEPAIGGLAPPAPPRGVLDWRETAFGADTLSDEGTSTVRTVELLHPRLLVRSVCVLFTNGAINQKKKR